MTKIIAVQSKIKQILDHAIDPNSPPLEGLGEIYTTKQPVNFISRLLFDKQYIDSY